MNIKKSSLLFIISVYSALTTLLIFNSNQIHAQEEKSIVLRDETPRVLSNEPKKSIERSSYYISGISLGTPGLINFHLGMYGELFGFSGSISFLHIIEIWASEENNSTSTTSSDISFAIFQLNLDIKLYERKDFFFALSAAGGSFIFHDEENPDHDINAFYAGPALHILYGNIYLELGIAYAKDFTYEYEEESTGLIPLFQIGYMGKFKL